MDAHGRESLSYLWKIELGSPPSAFRTKFILQFAKKKKKQAIEVLWQIFLMGLFKTVKYLQCEIFQLPFP